MKFSQVFIISAVCICLTFLMNRETSFFFSQKIGPQRIEHHEQVSTQWLNGLPESLVDRFKEEANLYKVKQQELVSSILKEGMHQKETIQKETIKEDLKISSEKENLIPLPIKTIPSTSLSNESRKQEEARKEKERKEKEEEDMKERVLLFIVIRSKDTNKKIRSTARKTWLSKAGLVNNKLAQYKFFIDKVGCCVEENKTEKDLVVASSKWLHSNFTSEYGETLGYKDLAWGGKGFSTQNYARDWDINLIMWATKNYNFKYIVNIDDDAFLCGPHLIYQLNLLPTTLSSFILGYRRWDAFDNCFILLTRDISNFLVSDYYSQLRPTHHPSTHFNFKGAGSSFGGAWSVKVGNWIEVFKKNGYNNIVFRNGGISESCVSCSRLLTKLGKPGSQCEPAREDYWVNKCTNASTDTGHCKLPDCFPNPNHRCHSPLIDHRTFNDAWSKVTKDKNNFFNDPTHVCVSRFIFDKIKHIPDMDTWWNLTGPHNSKASKHSFQDLSNYLLYPNQEPKICHAVNPKEPARVGMDVDPIKNFNHIW